MADTKTTHGQNNPNVGPTGEPIVRPKAPTNGGVSAQGEPIVKPQGEPIVRP